MDANIKQFMLAKLREQFVLFINQMIAMPGSAAQKQQAFLRFDEGHMWMQNAIVNYTEEVPDTRVPVPDLADESVPAIEDEAKKQIANELNQVSAENPIQPEGEAIITQDDVANDSKE